MVIVRIWDGLGNQMFQYAYARALKASGMDVRLDLQKAYDQTFLKYKHHEKRDNSIQYYRISLDDIDVCKYQKYSYLERNTLLRKAIFYLAGHSLWKYKFHEEKNLYYSRKSVNIRGDYYIKGWFQNEKYFRDIREILLREFCPKEKIRISRELKELLAYEETVSVHIRRGDFVRVDNSLPLSYYKKAFEKMESFYSNPKYLFFSDDCEWTKKCFGDMENAFFLSDYGSYQDYEELMIMSRCKSNIIANSTFSWWGAWLNRNSHKIVIAPRHWFDTQEEIVPDGWIRI